MPEPSTTFFTIADSGFFLGAVALVNSLRLTGHSQDIVLLDCGLTAGQRDLLSAQCRLVPFPAEKAANPTLFKPFAHTLGARGTVTIIDSDMIVTSSLEPVLREAASGRVCAFPDGEPHRWFAEWQDIFDLPAPPRHQTYVNAGFVVFDTERWPWLLERWWASCQKIWSHPTLYEGAAGPTAQADQDALNALLMTEAPAGSVAVLDLDAAP